ncbi:MAG: DNA polymerase III subunit delta [Chitinophagales bacterium]
MEKGNFESIAADIKKRKFAPVYFFCGEEPYFIDQLVDLLEAHVLNDMEKAFNQTIAYGKDVNARAIVETCGRLPMMAEKQLMIVKEAQALSLKEDEEKQYLAYLKNPVKSTVLVFAWKHGKPDGRKAFSKEVQKSAVFFESKPLYENQVGAWIKRWLSDRKYKLEEEANELLVESLGTDLSKIANELEKLTINKPSGSSITREDVEEQVGISKEYNVFELSNALGNKNRTKAYQITNYFVANPKSGPLVLVLGTLQTFFSKVYAYHFNKNLPDKDIAATIKVNPYFLKDYKAAAQHYSAQKLEHVFYTLEEYDLRSKGVGNSDIKEGELLKEMVYKILN